MAPAVKVGDKLPSVELFKDSPGNKVNLAELCAGKKVVIVGVPGAFTPTCHSSHVPGYITNAQQFTAKGVDLVICFTVNDPFVTKAWSEALGAGSKLTVLADPKAELTIKLGMQLDLTDLLGTVRSSRFALYAVDGVVKAVNAEEDSGKVDVSAAEAILAKI